MYFAVRYSLSHSWSILPTMWTQAEVHPTAGIKSHATTLNTDLQQWLKIWNISPEERFFVEGLRHNDLADTDELGPLEVEQIKKAALTFKRKTASGIDDAGPRNMALVSDDCLEAFSAIMEVAERIVEMPS